MYLTTECSFYYMADCDDPNRILEIGQLRQTELPDAWTLSTRRRTLVASFGSLVLTRRLDEEAVVAHEIKMAKNYNSIVSLTSTQQVFLLI